MKICLLTSVLVLLIFGMVSSSKQVDEEPIKIYVAVNGKDSWTGNLPSPNNSKTDGPFATLERARDIAMNVGLRYVYMGNVPFHEGENTYCHQCGEMLIRRVGYNVEVLSLRDGRCTKCGTKIPGVWTQEQALAFRPN